MKRHAPAVSAGLTLFQRARSARTLFGVVVAAAVAASLLIVALSALAMKPRVAVEAITEVKESSVHIVGGIEPDEEKATDWDLEFSPSGDCSAPFATEAEGTIPAGASGRVTIEETITGLQRGQEYCVQITATNSDGSATSGPAIFTTSPAEPPGVTLDSVSAITASSAHFSGSIEPDADAETNWSFTVFKGDPSGTSCPGAFVETGGSGTIASGTSGSVPVEGDITGLVANQKYCLLLGAGNGGGFVERATGFTTSVAPPSQVQTGFVGYRTDTTAQIQGFVNPEGEQAITYRFEWSENGVDWNTLPDKTKEPFSRQGILVVGDVLTGLTPGTTYHFRLVSAENSAGVTPGSGERTFSTRTTAETQLPQRGIELVNNPDKGNQNIALFRPTTRPTLVRADGDRTLWNVLAGAPGGNSGTKTFFIADRTPAGWVSRPLDPPPGEFRSGSDAYDLVSATPELDHFLVKFALAGAFFDGTPPTYATLDDEQHQKNFKTFNTIFKNSGWFTQADMTEDGEHVVIVNQESVPSTLEEVGPSPEVLSIMPDGKPNECRVSWLNSEGDSGNQSFPEVHYMDVHDASRVYFATPPSGGENCFSHPAGIFFRDRTIDQTIELDDGATTPLMVRATPDGKSLYFLTSATHAAEDVNGSRDLYRWDSEGGAYVCVTCIDSAGGGVGGVRLSLDYSHVYFTSTNQLIPGFGRQGDANLYVLSGGELTFIADVGTVDFLAMFNMYISNNGNTLLYAQEGARDFTELTADVVAPGCALPGNSEVKRCPQLFRYEDSVGSLECVSCVRGGVTADPVGSSGHSNFNWAQSGDGSTTAFTSKEPLVPEDINNSADVYQWRNGTVGLISDGETVYPSLGTTTPPKVWGLDEDGSDLFFTLVDSDLTGYEQDGVTNLYDARIGGGFPRPEAPAHCSEESCQGPLQPAPSQPGAGSASFQGEGNVTPRRKRCGKGKVRRKGHCVRKKKREHRKHSKNRAGANQGGSK